MASILFVINTYNEEKRIGPILCYYQQFGEVILVDNHSSDATVEIAASLGVKYYLKKNNGTVQTVEWMSWLKETIGEVPYIALSCSEYLSPVTIKAIWERLLEPGVGVVELKMRSLTEGVELPLWGRRTRYVDRGLNLGRLDINAVKIHAPVLTLDGTKYKKVRLADENCVEHLRVTNFASELIKVVNYARVEAQVTETRQPLARLIKSLTRELVNLFIPKNLLYARISMPQIFLRCVMHYVIFREVTETRSEIEKEYERKFNQ